MHWLWGWESRSEKRGEGGSSDGWIYKWKHRWLQFGLSIMVTSTNSKAGQYLWLLPRTSVWSHLHLRTFVEQPEENLFHNGALLSFLIFLLFTTGITCSEPSDTGWYRKPFNSLHSDTKHHHDNIMKIKKNDKDNLCEISMWSLLLM